MPTLFISDLHLDASRPETTQLFLKFLAHDAEQADALYILGDLFEYWIGDDMAAPLHEEVAQALHTLSQHTPVYYLHGNRDFLIGNQYLTRAGCRLLSDPSVIDLYGKSVLLMHGDTLCTKDKAYLQFRRFVRKPGVKKLFLSLPLWLRRQIAKLLRHGSNNANSRKTEEIMDVTPEAVTTAMQQHQTQLLIHGHTHRPAIHNLEINQQPAQRIVLGAWHDEGSVLIIKNDRSVALESLMDLKKLLWP